MRPAARALRAVPADLAGGLRSTLATSLLLGVLGVLAAPAAIAQTLPAPVAGAAAHRIVAAHRIAATPGPTSVHSCSQRVARGHFTCFALRRTDAAALPARTPAAGSTARSTSAPAYRAAVNPAGLHPVDLVAAYALPTASATAGTGQTVYVVDAFDDPHAESDLAAYRAQFGLPACTRASGCFRKVNQNGATSPLPAPDAGWAGEVSLDLDMVSAVCPRCHITLVESDDAGSDMLLAVKRATTMGATFVSMSWGGDENSSASAYDSAYFKSTGVVYTASSGDSGYAAGPSYPATSPRVVAVGGTSLSPAPNARGWTESAWSGAGSSCSTHEARPGWQAGVTACTLRGTTDVSAVADPSTGVAVYQTYGAGGWTVYGGTSAAAPIIAGVFALAGTPAGTEQPPSLPYRLPAQLNDVTAGSNGSCSTVVCHAADGWDGPTGLGTPNGLGPFTPPRPPRAGSVVSPSWPSVPHTGPTGPVGGSPVHSVPPRHPL